MEGEAVKVADIDISGIMRRIPHRYPFLMIDRMTDVVLNQSATGIKCVSIEAMAQTAAVLVVSTLGPDAEGKLVYFMSIDKARFRRPVGPGDVVHVHVDKDRHRGNVWRFNGTAKVDGNVVSDAVFSAMIMDD